MQPAIDLALRIVVDGWKPQVRVNPVGIQNPRAVGLQGVGRDADAVLIEIGFLHDVEEVQRVRRVRVEPGRPGMRSYRQRQGRPSSRCTFADSNVPGEPHPHFDRIAQQKSVATLRSGRESYQCHRGGHAASSATVDLHTRVVAERHKAQTQVRIEGRYHAANAAAVQMQCVRAHAHTVGIVVRRLHAVPEKQRAVPQLGRYLCRQMVDCLPCLRSDGQGQSRRAGYPYLGIELNVDAYSGSELKVLVFLPQVRPIEVYDPRPLLVSNRRVRRFRQRSRERTPSRTRIYGAIAGVPDALIVGMPGTCRDVQGHGLGCRDHGFGHRRPRTDLRGSLVAPRLDRHQTRQQHMENQIQRRTPRP